MIRNKKKNNKVSIIIPCFNGEQFVDRCMSSILNQIYSCIECIVVDDGSIDKSREKILVWKERFIEKKWELIYFYQENMGPGAAINTGLKLVTGRYIMLLDIDDEYLPGAISEKATYLDDHQDIYVVRSNGWVINGEEKHLFVYEDNEKKIKNVFMALLRGETNNWAGSYMIRADKLFEFYPKREIYKSKYGQNLQLLLPLLYKKNCGYIDQPQMNYIRRGNSLSKTSDTSESEKKSLENVQGYWDIRIHMVNQIINDVEEKNKILKQVEVAYWRSVMRIALQNKNKRLMNSSYRGLKIIEKPEINDKIIYMQLKCPSLVWGLKIIRKIKKYYSVSKI